MEINKLSIEQLQEFWIDWECEAGESFIDYFVDDNIHNVGVVLGYWAAKYPDLFKYIMNQTDYHIRWKYVQDWDKTYGGLIEIIENYYKVEKNEVFDEDNYVKSIIPWCDVICNVDIYYVRFLEWCDSNNINLSKYAK